LKGRALGVDLGATWLRAALVEDGRLVRRWKVPAVRWTELEPALRRLKTGKLDRLTVGPTGVWKASDRKRLAFSLKKFSKAVRVVSDVELAHEAAFGGGPGILVIAGTGSIAFGRDGSGRTARAGGLGALLGDEGSAFWLGREALRHPKLKSSFPESLALRLAHEPKPVRAIAALAPKVLKLARKNAAARAIVREGALSLAGAAASVGKALRFKGKIPVCCHGSLFRDETLRAFFERGLGGRFAVTTPATAADVAAARVS